MSLRPDREVLHGPLRHASGAVIARLRGRAAFLYALIPFAGAVLGVFILSGLLVWSGVILEVRELPSAEAALKSAGLYALAGGLAALLLRPLLIPVIEGWVRLCLRRFPPEELARTVDFASPLTDAPLRSRARAAREFSQLLGAYSSMCRLKQCHPYPRWLTALWWLPFLGGTAIVALSVVFTVLQLAGPWARMETGKGLAFIAILPGALAMIALLPCIAIAQLLADCALQRAVAGELEQRLPQALGARPSGRH